MNDQEFNTLYYKNHTDHFLSKTLSDIPSFVYIRDTIQAKPKENILDAGCGTGYLLNFITPNRSYGFGIDISSTAIKEAKKTFPRFSFQKGSLLKLPYKNNFFDKVYSFNVIEHIENQDLAIKELMRVLKPGGIIVLGTNDKNSLSWKLFCLFYGGDPTHKHEFSSNEFVSFVKKYFTVTDTRQSSCIGRFHPLINSIFHKILKGDILVTARK